MSISAITLLSGYELFRAMKTVGDRESADLVATAGIVHGLDRIRDDLLHTLPRIGSQQPVFASVSPNLETLNGTARLLTCYSLCTCNTYSRIRGLRQICQVSYELVKTAGSIRLYRRATPVVGTRPISDPEDRKLVLDRIDRIEMTFYNGRTWEPRFSSRESLPAAVTLEVTVGGQTWPLSIELPCGDPEAGF